MTRILHAAGGFLLLGSLLFLLLDQTALEELARPDVELSAPAGPVSAAPLQMPTLSKETAQYNRLQSITAEQLEILGGPEAPVDDCLDGSCFKGGIILLHQGRCGSTVLMRMLGWNNPNTTDIAFPDIPSPEALRHLGIYPPKENMTSQEVIDGPYASRDELLFQMNQIQESLSRFTPSPSANGMLVSMKMYQIANPKMKAHDFLTIMAASGFRHLIVLHRNYLRVGVSGVLAKRTMEFHTGFENRNCMGVTNTSRLTMDWESKLESWQRLDDMYAAALSHPAFPNRLAISYENDIYEDPAVAARKINAFLGRDAPMGTALLAHTTECPLPSLISNYDEGLHLLSDTRHEYLLELDGNQAKLPRSEILTGMCPVDPAEVGLEFLPCT